MNTVIFQSSARTLQRRQATRGFTLVEALAAIMFLAIVIPVALRAIQIASRSGVIAERRLIAVELAQEKLNDFMVAGDWSSGDQTGDFADEHPGYDWALTVDQWDAV